MKIKGIYCERPTWKQSTYVTRMDRPLNYQLVIGRTSVPGVRQSPIKTRSLTTQNLDTLCAYQQCQNNAKCVENQNDVYTCICQKGKISYIAILLKIFLLLISSLKGGSN